MFRPTIPVVFSLFLVGLTAAHNYRWQASGSQEVQPPTLPLPRKDVYPYPGRGGWRGQPPRRPPPTNPSEICPCVRRKDTGECVTYDPKFQAISVEEAILNFPDLQIDVASKSGGGGVGGGASESVYNISGSAAEPPQSPKVGEFGPTTPNDNVTFLGSIARSRVSATKQIPDTSIAQQPPNTNNATASAGSASSTSLCGDDRECKACSAAMISQLSKSGLLEQSEAEEVSKRMGVQQQLPQRGSNCDKYRFGQVRVQYARVAGQPMGANASAAGAAAAKSVDPALDNLVKQLQQKGEENWRKQQSSKRTKRQSSSKQGNTLGQQFKIDCSKRGEPVESGSSWVGLCNVCWAWRKLPSNYFPQYVNELICDTDTKCMSGWGSCQQRYKSVDILQNTGTDSKPTWKQVTISVANYCDCEVQSGSSMHNFVAA